PLSRAFDSKRGPPPSPVWVFSASVGARGRAGGGGGGGGAKKKGPRHFRGGPRVGPLAGPLLQVVPEPAAQLRVSQLTQRLGLDLARPFPGDPQVGANLFEGPATPVLQPEAELQRAPLARCQVFEDVLDLLAQELLRDRVRGRDRRRVGDELAEVALILFANP